MKKTDIRSLNISNVSRQRLGLKRLISLCNSCCDVGTFLVQLMGRLPTNTVLFFFVTSSSILFLFICLFITYCSASFPSLGSVFFFFFAGPFSSSSAQCKLSSLKSKGSEERGGGYRLKEVKTIQGVTRIFLYLFQDGYKRRLL